VQDLEGDRTRVPEVVGVLHRGHSTPPELALEDVTVSKDGRESRGNIAQRGSELDRRPPRWEASLLTFGPGNYPGVSRSGGITT
jgi:hypothetical protein